MAETKAGRKKDIDIALWWNSQGWIKRIGKNDSHFSGNPAVFKREDPWLSAPTSQ